MNATLNPEVLQWARKKAGLTEETLAKKIGVQLGLVKEWESSGSIPINLVEKLAEKTRIAFGFLFLKELPRENLPIADFRAPGEAVPHMPSDDLLEVIYEAQRKQNWYREFLISNDAKPLPFVGRYSLNTPVMDVAASIRETVKIGSELRNQTSEKEKTIGLMTEAVENCGILVLRSGFAGPGTYKGRKLDRSEFQGFALSDEYAPLIFVNGADFPAAQIFTIAHELAHIWIGKTGVSILEKTYSPGSDIETFCNRVAAEVLLPISELRDSWKKQSDYTSQIERIAYKFRISRIVVARRAHDAGIITDEQFFSYYRRIGTPPEKPKATWSDYFKNEKYRNSRIFSVAILQETFAGRVMERDAMQFLGIKKEPTLKKYAQSLQEGMGWPIF